MDASTSRCCNEAIVWCGDMTEQTGEFVKYTLEEIFNPIETVTAICASTLLAVQRLEVFLGKIYRYLLHQVTIRVHVMCLRSYIFRMTELYVVVRKRWPTIC